MDALNIIYSKIAYFMNSPQFVNMVTNNRFYLILFVVLLMRLKYNTYRSMWASALINIPGTFLHELMHFLVGSVFNAKPYNFTVIPRKNSNGDYIMGSVGFYNIRWYNAIPAAMAPFLLLPIAFYVNRYLLPQLQPSLSNYVLYILLQTILIENAIPSGQDFKVASLFVRGIALYVAILVFWLLFFF